MRCPKCQYLGFEPSPRCKNCGYDFSFGSDDLPGLTIVPEPGPQDAMADFDLQVFDDASPRPKSTAIAGGFDLDDLLARGRSEPALQMDFNPAPVSTTSAVATVVSEPVPAEPVPPPAPARAVVARPAAAHVPPPAPVTTELPLFMQVMSDAAIEPPVAETATPAPVAVVEEIDDRPLVQVPAVLRPPLAVRRTTPDPARLRAKYARASAKSEASAAGGDLLRGIDETEASAAQIVPVADRLSAEPTPQSLPAGWLQGVSAGKRISAAALDTLLLGSLNAAIVWFTLSVCGMAPSQAHLLPLAPIALFFLLVDGGYLVLFTAACGQTIGKMAAGIRVVGTSTGAVINDRITVGQALARSLAAIASCLPLGAGFWMSLIGDGRSFHDRIAHTRVVRA